MPAKSIFVSHSSKDDGIVRELRQELETLGIETWADSERLSGGDLLTPEIQKAIEDADHFLVVVSLNALNSALVQREIKHARSVRKPGYKIVPLARPGIEPPVLGLLFGEDAQSAPAPVDPAAPAVAPAPPKACRGFDGTWSTNYGDVILRVTGDQFEGENPSYRARVKGRVTGQTLAGVRTIAGYADAAITFVLAPDGAKFDGTVDIAPGRSITWKGACAGAVPASR